MHGYTKIMDCGKLSELETTAALLGPWDVLLIRYDIRCFGSYECVLCSRANSVSREHNNFNLSNVERRPKLKSCPLAERNQWPERENGSGQGLLVASYWAVISLGNFHYSSLRHRDLSTSYFVHTQRPLLSSKGRGSKNVWDSVIDD